MDSFLHFPHPVYTSATRSWTVVGAYSARAGGVPARNGMRPAVGPPCEKLVQSWKRTNSPQRRPRGELRRGSFNIPPLAKLQTQKRQGDNAGCSPVRGVMCDGAEERGVNFELRLVPQAKAVAHDLDALRRVDQHIMLMANKATLRPTRAPAL